MDKTFFAIVRRFGLGVAFVTLLGAICGIAWAIYSYSSPVNENIAEPKVQYREFKLTLTAKTTPAADQDDSTPAASDPAERTKASEFDRKFEAHLQRILEAASKYLQPDLNLTEAYRDGLREGCKTLISQLSEKNRLELGEAFMVQFEAATVAFVGDGLNSANMTDSAAEKGQRWDMFSNWMFETYRSRLHEETERISQEKLKAEFRKAQAGVVATAAGTCFVIFLLFTLMLVLLAIERNTRPQPKATGEERPTQSTD